MKNLKNYLTESGDLPENYNSTIIRSIYNKYYKKEFNCTYCRVNKGCNSSNKWYGGYLGNINKSSVRYPSWKLVSKSRKQFMKNKFKFKIKYNSILNNRGSIVFDQTNFDRRI